MSDRETIGEAAEPPVEGACPTCHRPYPRVKVQDYPRPTEAELLALAPGGSRWSNPWDDEIAVSLGIDPEWRDASQWHEDYVPEPVLLMKRKGVKYDDVFSVPCTYVREGGIYSRVDGCAGAGTPGGETT